MDDIIEIQVHKILNNTKTINVTSQQYARNYYMYFELD